MNMLSAILGGRTSRFTGEQLATLASYVDSEGALMDLTEDTLQTAFPQPETSKRDFCRMRDAIVAWKAEKRTGENIGICMRLWCRT